MLVIFIKILIKKMKDSNHNSLATSAHQKTKQFFTAGKCEDVSYRRASLLRLKKVIKTKEDAICEAIYQDFKKPKFESLATETQFVLAEISHILTHLKQWSKPKKVSPGLSNFPSRDYVQYDSYGQVLISAPWNYPFQLWKLSLVFLRMAM